MFCPNCGNQLADGAKFCPKCGNPVGKARALSPQDPSEEPVPHQTQVHTPQSPSEATPALASSPTAPAVNQAASPRSGKNELIRTVAIVCGICIAAVAAAAIWYFVYNAAPSQLESIPEGYYSIASDSLGARDGYDFRVEEDGTLTFSDYDVEDYGWSVETDFHDYLAATPEAIGTLGDSTVFELDDIKILDEDVALNGDTEVRLVVPNGCGRGNPAGLWCVLSWDENSDGQGSIAWAQIDVDGSYSDKGVIGTAHAYSGNLDPDLLSFNEDTWSTYLDQAISSGSARSYQVRNISMNNSYSPREFLDESGEPVAIVEIAGGFVADPPSIAAYD